MNWQTKGILYHTDSYATMPTALVLEDCIRLFYSKRDDEGRSHPMYIELDFDFKITKECSQPILELGNGTFDDSGIMPSCVIKYEDNYLMCYVGWNRNSTLPYRTAIGLAGSMDGERFGKLFQGPILDRSINNPYFVTTPWIMTNPWRMWYASGVDQIFGETRYLIKHATSQDGVTWTPDTMPDAFIPVTFDAEIQCRPCILDDKMWFCYRPSKKTNYKIGCAQKQPDGKWTRLDDEISSNGQWDSEMMAYPNVISLKDKLVMFYNGNSFGKHGIGYAVHNIRQ